MTTLIFSNEEINDIIKIIKSLQDAGLLIKGICEKKRRKLNKRAKRWISRDVTRYITC